MFSWSSHAFIQFLQNSSVVLVYSRVEEFRPEFSCIRVVGQVHQRDRHLRKGTRRRLTNNNTMRNQLLHMQCTLDNNITDSLIIYNLYYAPSFRQYCLKNNIYTKIKIAVESVKTVKMTVISKGVVVWSQPVPTANNSTPLVTFNPLTKLSCTPF